MEGMHFGLGWMLRNGSEGCQERDRRGGVETGQVGRCGMGPEVGQCGTGRASEGSGTESEGNKSGMEGEINWNKKAEQKWNRNR